ncbi:MAG: 7-cyano-7-deazaguanine synthase QueC [Dehalococcoidia bacterium]|nr:7-cyano-7-deazaguanine synthase QueC [Dehalococcoidia bacterium]
MNRKTIVLLSGGLDSTTTLAIARDQGFLPYALTFRYGLRHEFEIEAARRVARKYDVQNHIVIDINLRAFGGSALTGEGEIPKDRPMDNQAAGIPATYVPARNTIFLSFALAWAEVVNVNDIFIGVNAVDYSGYPDCRPEYIAAFRNMANLATRMGVEGKQSITIHTPLINLSKAQIIQKGMALGMDYSLTHSCYDPLKDGGPCGHCDACRLRLKGFKDAGLTDPLIYPDDIR